jgi:hypothetical protein
MPGMVGAPGGMTPDQWHADKAAREMYERNRPLSDEELDALLPGAEQVRAGGWAGGQAGAGQDRQQQAGGSEASAVGKQQHLQHAAVGCLGPMVGSPGEGSGTTIAHMPATGSVE